MDYTLATLPEGATVGTSSLRRAAQLLARVRICGPSPCAATWIRACARRSDGQYDAIILAGAGLTRLGLEKHVTEWLSLDVMLPAPGQGALAVQCRVDDHETLSLLAALEDPSTRKAVTAERAFLSGLGGGCSVPVAAYATVESAVMNLPKDQRPKVIKLTGLVISEDGKKAIQVSRMVSMHNSLEVSSPSAPLPRVRERSSVRRCWHETHPCHTSTRPGG